MLGESLELLVVVAISTAAILPVVVVAAAAAAVAIAAPSGTAFDDGVDRVRHELPDNAVVASVVAVGIIVAARDRRGGTHYHHGS